MESPVPCRREIIESSLRKVQLSRVSETNPADVSKVCSIILKEKLPAFFLKFVLISVTRIFNG